MSKDEVNVSPTAQWGVFGVGLLVLIVCLIYGSLSTNASTSDVTALQEEVATLNNQLGVKRREEQKVRDEVVYKTTGIHPQTVSDDQTLFEEFITPAFTWTSGSEYDEVRADYIERLGEDSPFVSVYLAENLKVDDYNYIDLNELKSTYLGMDIYPLEERDNAMEYMGVIDYFLYKEEADLVGRNDLTTSKAIVKFTVLGEGDDRRVTNIKADPGFISNE